LPTAATLAADCAALISELKSARARLLAMDREHIVFQRKGARAAEKPKNKSTKDHVPTDEFVQELAERLDRIDDRVHETASRVRQLAQRGIVTSGFPSGLIKSNNP
jgi:hypothetical protein